MFLISLSSLYCGTANTVLSVPSSSICQLGHLLYRPVPGWTLLCARMIHDWIIINLAPPTTTILLTGDGDTSPVQPELITFKNNFKPDFIFRRSDTIHSYLGREELDMILWTHPDSLGVRPEVSIYRCRSVTVLTWMLSAPRLPTRC